MDDLEFMEEVEELSMVILDHFNSKSESVSKKAFEFMAYATEQMLAFAAKSKQSKFDEMSEAYRKYLGDVHKAVKKIVRAANKFEKEKINKLN